MADDNTIFIFFQWAMENAKNDRIYLCGVAHGREERVHQRVDLLDVDGVVDAHGIDDVLVELLHVLRERHSINAGIERGGPNVFGDFIAEPRLDVFARYVLIGGGGGGDGALHACEHIVELLARGELRLIPDGLDVADYHFDRRIFGLV